MPVNTIDKTCPNCAHACMKGIALCTLGRISFNGEYVSAASLRIQIYENGYAVYDDRVDGPCGPKSKYWEDGRKGKELGWHLEAEVTAYESPMKVEVLLDPHIKSLAERMDIAAAARAINMRKLQIAADENPKLKEAGESLIDRALKQHNNEDVWGKPFKMAE